jgi:nucleoid-associated protein YgaU
MGLIDFVKNVGRKLNLDRDDDKQQGKAQPGQAGTQHAGQQPGAQAQQAKAAQDQRDRMRAMALVKLVEQMGFKVNDLSIRVDDDRATVAGQVDSQEQREKVVLLVGNTEGIGRVDDQLKVSRPEPEAVFYEVKSGDSLSKIAKQHYGDANKYNQIFEANRPMLKDPDEIYPGQKLRIPDLAHAGAGQRA